MFVRWVSFEINGMRASDWATQNVKKMVEKAEPLVPISKFQLSKRWLPLKSWLRLKHQKH